MSTLPPCWIRILTLVEQWAGPLRAEEGNSAQELLGVESELGQPLPELIRLWYRLLGRSPRFLNADAPVHLTPLGQLELTSLWEDLEGENCAGQEADYPRRLVVYDEGEYQYSWIVLEADLALPDPPLYLEDPSGVFGGEFLLYASTPRFSDFAAQALAFTLAQQAPYSFVLETAAPCDDAARLLTPVAELPLLYPQELCFWFGDGVLIGTLDDSWFCAEASSSEARDAFLATLTQPPKGS